MTEFSVLMSVYRGDNPAHLRRALTSISTDQQLAPNQIVLVRDGPLPKPLQAVFTAADEICHPVRLTPVVLEENRGLARALQAGLAHCDYDIVARADADDICLPQRFAKQIPKMADLDLLGAAIQEFHEDEGNAGLVRTLPEGAAEIRQILPLRDPFNHPAVVLRKSAVAAVGGYDNLTKMEDYWLFARMVHAGARVANLSEVLVYYRVGAGAYHRRGGIDMLQAEYRLQRALHCIGVTSTWQMARNVAVRCSYRLIPAAVRKALYHTAMRTGWRR